jgi:23S rRNA (cytosine1962-C5)-methyltransferase
LAKWVAGRRVLDLFCYEGGWSLAAARSGASEVVGVDRSAGALQRARLNAQQNRLDGPCQFHQADALAFLKEVPRQSFDVVIVDPPAFAKTRKALPEAQKGYIDLNRRALLALSAGGLLVSCSCSHHVGEDLFQALLLRAAQASGRRLRLLEARSQALDHPILLAMPEMRYLKCAFLDAI